MAGCTLNAEEDELLKCVSASGVSDKARSPTDRQLVVLLFIYVPKTDKAWFGLVLNTAASGRNPMHNIMQIQGLG